MRMTCFLSFLDVFGATMLPEKKFWGCVANNEWNDRRNEKHSYVAVGKETASFCSATPSQEKHAGWSTMNFAGFKHLFSRIFGMVGWLIH